MSPSAGFWCFPLSTGSAFNVYLLYAHVDGGDEEKSGRFGPDPRDCSAPAQALLDCDSPLPSLPSTPSPGQWVARPPSVAAKLSQPFPPQPAWGEASTLRSCSTSWRGSYYLRNGAPAWHLRTSSSPSGSRHHVPSPQDPFLLGL